MRDESQEDESDNQPSVVLMGRRFRIPSSRPARLCAGGSLVVLGMFGFLPVLGFWMIPLGLLILSYDLASVRRRRRKLAVWWNRRKQNDTAPKR